MKASPLRLFSVLQCGLNRSTGLASQACMVKRIWQICEASPREQTALRFLQQHYYSTRILVSQGIFAKGRNIAGAKRSGDGSDYSSVGSPASGSGGGASSSPRWSGVGGAEGSSSMNMEIFFAGGSMLLSAAVSRFGGNSPWSQK